jgi:hypothetical protein
LGHASALHRIGAFAPLLDHLSAAGFAGLNAELDAMDPSPDVEILALFFRRWAQVSPEAAFAAAEKKKLWQPVLFAWVERDPDAALAQFEKMPPGSGFFAGSMRDQLRALAMPKPGQLPPQDAVRRISELQGDGDATPAVLNAMAAILQDWAKTDPQGAWRAALALSSTGKARETREWALGSVIRSQVGSDPDVVLGWLQALPDGEDRATLEASYVSAVAWAGKSRQAREFALAMPEGPARQHAIADVTAALFRRDPDAAKAFIVNLPAADWRDPSIFQNVFDVWLGRDPEGATAGLLKRFPKDAPSGSEEQQAYERMFFMWSARHPREASEFFLKLPEAVGAKLLDKSIATYAYQEPEAAADWAAALPPGATRDRALAEVATMWTRRGVTSVTNWLQQLPEDSGRSAAIESFANVVVSTSPDDALAWLRAIPGENDRMQRLQRVWGQWTDRDAARRWLETSTELTDSERNALRQDVKKP